MKRIIVFMIVLSFMITTCVYAKVGEPVEDPGALPAEFEMEPYAETLNTTRYAPWFLMYHMWSEKEKEMGRRAGEGGQIVMSIAMSPVNPDLMLMGNDTGGLWRSTDGGQNWYSVNNNVNMWSVPDIEFDPKDENTVYMIQSVYGFIDSTKDKLKSTTLKGVYKSTDAGKTWKQVLEVMVAATRAANHLMAFDNYGHLYVLTSEGVMKTKDGGETWENLGVISKSNVFDLRVSSDGKMIVAACVDTGINVSFDGGATWQQKNGDLEPSATAVAVLPGDKDHWMAIFRGNSLGLYESFDRGDTWLPVEYYKYGSGFPEALEVTPPKENGKPTIYLLYSTMGYPFRCSNDLGKTWEERPNVHNQDIFTKGTTGYYAEGICVHPNDPNTVYYSFGDIIYKSTDGAKNFHYLSSGFSGNYSNDYVFDKEGKIYFPFTDKGLGVTTSPYDGSNYPTAKMVEGIGRYAGSTTVRSIAINPGNSDHMIISLGTWSKQMLKQTFDGGKTWEEIPGTEGGDYNTIVFHPNDANIIYTDHFTSRDGGQTWQKNDVEIWDVSRVNPNILWGKIGKIVSRSSDGGKTWSQIVETSDPKVIKADLFDENVAWVGCYNGTVVKIAGNKAVTMGVENGLIRFGGNPILIQSLAQNPVNPLHLLAGGRCTVAGTKSPGLYETLDGGETWHVVPGLLGPRTIETIAFSENTREAFLGGYNGTIIYEYDKFHNRFETNGKQQDTADEGEEKEISVIINGKRIEFDVQPALINSRTFVPMRKIFEELGAEISWNENTSTVTAKKDDTVIALQINNSVATVNNEKIQLDAPPCIIDGRTLVPIRFVAQSLGAIVRWDGANKIVSIGMRIGPPVSYTEIITANTNDDKNTTEEKNDINNADDGLIIKITDVGVVDIAEPDENVYEKRGGSWPDQIGTTILNGVEYDKRIYYKADLSSVIGKNIVSAKLVIRERGMKYGARMYVYKITEDWDMTTISYKKAPAYSDENIIAQRLCEGYESSATTKELDITEYVKTLTSGNSIANIMIKATSSERKDASHIFGINSNDPPYIKVVVK